MPEIFLHIPKAGGSTLYKIIGRNYNRNKIFHIHGAKIKESILNFKNLNYEGLDSIKILTGHMGFGLHNHFQNESIYFTLLRNPVDRIISHYYYVLRKPNHYLYNQVKQDNMSLEDYIDNEISGELINGQTRLLSAEDGNFYSSDKLNYKDLEKAKKNLSNHFAFVGILEEFDKSLILMKEIFGWERIYYYKRNVSSKRPSKSEIQNKVIHKIKEKNKLDIDLYNYAKEKYNGHLNSYGKNMNKELEKLKKQNYYFSLLMSPYIRLKNYIKNIIR